MRTSRLVHVLWFPVLTAALLSATCGCVHLGGSGPVQVDIEGEDFAVFPEARVSFAIPPTRESRIRDLFQGTPIDEDQIVSPSPGGPRFFVEGRWSSARGDLPTPVGAGEFIDLGSTSFVGPDATVRTEYEIDVSQVGGRVRLPFEAGEHVGADARLALAFLNLEHVVRSATERASESELGVGPNVGGQVWVRPVRWLRIFTGVGGSWVLGTEEASLLEFDVGASVAPGPGVELFGGWRQWWYEQERDGFTGDDSDVDLDLSGPFFGMGVTF